MNIRILHSALRPKTRRMPDIKMYGIGLLMWFVKSLLLVAPGPPGSVPWTSFSPKTSYPGAVEFTATSNNLGTLRPHFGSTLDVEGHYGSDPFADFPQIVA